MSNTREHGPEITALVDAAHSRKNELDEKDSVDPRGNLERSLSVHALVTALHNAGVRGPQTEAARLLNVSKTVTNRHVRKAREWLDEKDSVDPRDDLERSLSVHTLVTALHNAGVREPQTEAARLLNVSKTVTNRHVRKAREWLDEKYKDEYARPPVDQE